ncbi:MAG TPA: ABC transporter substrate-binding protein [Patescibacteria group bacterium]|nr:ABC transporter substrate-binding protein [Patescibacteria group bacterium]
MEEPAGRAGKPEARASRRPSAGSPTRGFLFADLRDYTRYLEGHGAAHAADLLVRYRTLVRQAVAEHAGAEIKTEGDSFYVVFPAVSAAVLCGLAIVEAARSGSADPAVPPIPVGIGIHAGETIETPDGFVGTPVNIAARICAIARPGEVLVSDTVRALTQTVLPVSFAARGRQKLKGVTDPVAVFAVAPTDDAWATQPGRRVRRGRSLVAAAILALGLLIVGLTVWTQLRSSSGLPPGPWTIGLDGPLVGKQSAGGIAAQNAVTLAIDDVNGAGGIGGSQLVLASRNDGADVPGAQDPGLGAANITAMVTDPRTIGVIGPRASRVAAKEIPITNAAGLLQCSQASTWPQLTKPRDGALDLRAAHPDRINFIRTAPSDDIQGVALASFVFRDLAAKLALVLDDGDTGGRDIADRFTEAYQKLGGTVVRRTLNSGDDPAAAIERLTGANAPQAVFFGGFTDSGAPDIRVAMAAAGKTAIPFVSWDGIQDGSGADSGSFLQSAGPAAAGSYFSHASIALPKADFADRYLARFGSQPDEYTASAYACAQVIFEALRAVAVSGPSAAELREAVRAYAVDPTHKYETAIGTVGFDANGDSVQQFVTFYRVDPSAAGGKGDWVIAKQQDYGPAP